MKYSIGDLVTDEDGNSGIVVIKWDDGDICALENDTAHPSPIIVGHSDGETDEEKKFRHYLESDPRLDGETI